MVYLKRRKATNPPKPQGPSKFNAELLIETALDVKSGARPTLKSQPWVSIGDDRQPGLRAIIRKSGAVTFHAMYYFGDSRPMITVGQFPETTIEEARHLTKVVRGLAEKGIDVQEGLHSRLLRELEEEGLDWRPDRNHAREDLLDRVLHLLAEHNVKVPPAVKSKIRSQLGTRQA